MSVIGWIVVGLLAGGIARWVVKDDRSGCIYTMVVGVLGALIGGALMNAIDSRGVDEFSIRGILVSALGAILLLLVLQALSGRDSGSRTRSRRR
ncbi:MAG: GlsB/YeaQ/YmgE family stress response membrane protein [Ilumatobacter sp.]|uniref:GlsB/YeaQ/YmgE family stress response membrane protein n=1 Tax=Ilumatobacter sp. TaxID=1967498 RepID=UPI0032978F31